MAVNKTDIYVYADWIGLSQSTFVGVLSAPQAKAAFFLIHILYIFEQVEKLGSLPKYLNYIFRVDTHSKYFNLNEKLI